MKASILALATLTLSVAAHATAPDAPDQSRPSRSCAGESTSASEPRVTAELGELNGKARSLPQPTYPRDAKRAGVTGKVVVRIVVDARTGNVVWVRVQSGPVELREASMDAACKAAFYPTMDVDAKVAGFLVYRFGKHH